MEIRVGTSGWHYKHWIDPYYQQRRPDAMLARYLQDFDTVEINNSFYRLPSPHALKKWRDRTPANFCFAAEASRFLTHMKKLKDAEQALTQLLPAWHISGYQSPLTITADFTYIRLHGPRGKYQGCYSHQELEAWARRIQDRSPAWRAGA